MLSRCVLHMPVAALHITAIQCAGPENNIEFRLNSHYDQAIDNQKAASSNSAFIN